VRRTIIIGTAIAMLVGASAAFASFNTYSASFTFSPTKAGSSNSPVPVGFAHVYHTGGTSGNRSAPWTDVKSTIYGLVSNGKYFPTCSLAKIAAAKNDNICPKGAEVATGVSNALLGPQQVPKAKGTPCNPGIDVWNAGPGKVVYVLTAKTALQCGGLKTGDAAPFYGYVSLHGKNLVIDVPQPPDVSTKVANIKGIYSSVILEKLTFKKLTTKVKGKTVGYLESVGCKAGKRPWTQSFTALNYPGQPGGTTSTQTVVGSAKCS